MKKNFIFTFMAMSVWIAALSQPLQVTSFTLIDPGPDTDIRELHSVDTIYANGCCFDLNIRANTIGSVGSVHFEYKRKDNTIISRVENAAPYALGADNNGDYQNWITIAGNYELTATPYSGKNRTGVKGIPLTIHLAFLQFRQVGQLLHYRELSSNRILNNKDTVYIEDNPHLILISTDSVLRAEFYIDGKFIGSDNFIQFSVPYNFNEIKTYIVTAVPFSEAFEGGFEGEPLTIELTVLSRTPVGEVTSLTLIEWDTDSDLRTLNPGKDTLQYPENYQNIRANTSGEIGSVLFEWERVEDGSYFSRFENVAPYAVGGDIEGDYQSWWLVPGIWTFTATPYRGANGTGEQGTPFVTELHVPPFSSFTTRQAMNGLYNLEISLKPNPAVNEVTLSWNSSKSINTYKIIDIAGNEILNNTTVSNNGEIINVELLQPGMYYLLLESDLGTEAVRFIKK